MKKNQSAITFLIAVLFLGIYSCAKDDIVVGESKVIFPEPTEVISASMLGSLEDEQGLPIVDALVVCQNCLTVQVTASDEKGDFQFLNVDVKGESGYVTVTSEGKFEAFRRMPLQEGKNNYTRVLMKEQVSIGRLKSGDGGQLVHESGATISMPADGLVDENGQAYEGDYEVYLDWIDPTAANLSLSMVGDLSAIAADGGLVGLSTYGMLQVELESADGTPLNLGANAIATLDFPVPESLRASAPSTIPLWTYNEENGYWLEEGFATLDGDRYIGDVSHFSTWNVDVKIDPVNICGSIIAVDEGRVLGLPYLQITLEGSSFQSVGGWLCDDGSFSFLNVPSGEMMTLTIYDFCGEVIETIELGPFEIGKVVLDPIIITDQADITYVEISGNALDCDGNPVSNGHVSISVELDAYGLPLDPDGSFSFIFPTCGAFQATVQVLDSDGFNLSVPIVVTEQSQTLNLQDVEVCGNEAEEYIYFTFHDPIQDQVVDRFYFEQDELHYRSGDTSIQIDRYLLVTTDDVIYDGIGITITMNPQLGATFTASAVVVLKENGVDFTVINSLELEFTDLGPLTTEGQYEYIEGNFYSEDEIQGGFRLKFQE